MAYANTRNYSGGTEREVDLKTVSHEVFNEHSFDDLGTSAVALAAYIVSKGKKPLSTRTHIEITNTHATAKIYVKRFFSGGVAATSAIYQYYLAPAGGYVKIPATIETDISIISDTASSTTALICELG